jgi:hypothetical protein
MCYKYNAHSFAWDKRAWNFAINQAGAVQRQAQGLP